MQRARFALGCIFVILTFAVLSLAQTGSISGTVSDQGGALVQGAEVTVVNLGSNATRTVTSSATGAYSIPNLAVGTYSVTIKKASFKAFHVDAVPLTVAQALTVNATLEPGAVTEEVQVRADQIPDVDLETAQISNLVASQQIRDLPLITRDPYSLVLLSPGTSQTNSRLGGFTVNGSRERNNNFLLDGVDNNDTSVPGIPDGIISANPDSTQEFRVITNNFNAEFGRNTGAIIDVVTKSGTNTFHGGAYYFGRWNSFGGGRDWFNPRVDSSGQLSKMDPYIRHQFGYSVGGPIFKNKTFFFFNEELNRFRTTLTNSATVPTAAFKTGVFNYTNDGQTVPIDLTPTGANNAFGAPLDPTIQQVLALYPNPPASGNGLTGTILFPSSDRLDAYNTVAKIDHHFTDREVASFRYAYDHATNPNSGHNDILPGNLGAVGIKAINQGLSAQLASTFTNSLINSFAFGWNRQYANFPCEGLSVLDSVSPLDRFGNGRDYNFDPFTSFGCTALVSDGQYRKAGTTSYTDVLSWVRGSHTFKFGFDFRNVNENGPNSFFSRRQLFFDTFFNTGFSLINPPANDSIALEDAASALYGFAWEDLNAEFFDKSGTRRATDNKFFRQHEYDWFGQDTWKIRHNFTLTLGLRYQLDGVPYEENDNLSNLLNGPLASPVVFDLVGPGTGKSLYRQDYSNIEPRVGFSWDPWGDGKTAIRGAFGIFHDRVFGNLFGNARGNPPFEQDYLQFPFETLNDAFGSGALPPIPPDTIPSTLVPDGTALGPVLFDTHFRNQASNNWNFGIQRELPGNNVIDLSYIGSKGTYLYRNIDGNPPDPALVQQLIAFCVPTNPANDPANGGPGCDRSTIQNQNLYLGAEFGALPFDAVAHNALDQPAFQRSVANSIYNSLQAKFLHRLSHGVQFQASYTWAHGIDNSADPIDPAAGNRTFPRNSRDLAFDRSNSDYDVRHIAVINYIWEVPLGRGKNYLNSGFMGRVLEGIQFAGITSAQTGHPFTVRTRRDSLGTGIANWATLVGDPFAPGSNNDPAQNQGLKVFFSNPDAFALPSFGSPPNINRNHFYGPNFVNFDLALTKTMKISERFRTELRVETFNLLNHPNFNNPGSDSGNFTNLVGSGELGLITSTVGRPDGTTSARQMQVALRLDF